MAFFGSGTVPQRTDTRRVLWFKKLMTIQKNASPALSHNNPNFYDTVTRLKFKCVRAAKGL